MYVLTIKKSSLKWPFESEESNEDKNVATSSVAYYKHLLNIPNSYQRPSLHQAMVPVIIISDILAIPTIHVLFIVITDI